MRVRALPWVLLLAAPLAAGDGPERDPFLAALAGRSGKDAVAAPDFDPDREAASWTLRPRREIVDALAARMLRGEADAISSAETGIAPPPTVLRILPVSPPAGDRAPEPLAARLPADAAAVLFGSLRDAEQAMDGLAAFLPRCFPALCGDTREGRREALRRGADLLLLPTIWGANPNSPRGIRRAALVVSDPDLRWAPDVALVGEVDDASLVRFHRQASLRWASRRDIVIRVDGLDAVADDGSVRSFFALEGGIAVWSTTRALRERILSAAAGRAHSLEEAGEVRRGRSFFPAAEGGALLVLPDAFLARIGSSAVRARRAEALRCEAARLLLDARAVSGRAPGEDLRCPSGGRLVPRAGGCGASCSIHGTAASPIPLGDLPATGTEFVAPVEEDLVVAGAFPLAAQWLAGRFEVLLPAGAPGARFLQALPSFVTRLPRRDGPDALRRRLRALRREGEEEGRAGERFLGLCGLLPWRPGDGSGVVMNPTPVETRKDGGVLSLFPRQAYGVNGGEVWDLRGEWR